MWKISLILDLPITYNDIFKVSSVPCIIPDFNLVSCEWHNFTFKVLYWVVLY